MRKENLNNFYKGWILGGLFDPTLCESTHFELAVKKYKKDEKEDSHYHRFATEYTIIVSGKVKMNNQIYFQDDIIIISPCESTNFEALEDTITVVCKVPYVMNDKFLDVTI